MTRRFALLFFFCAFALSAQSYTYWELYVIDGGGNSAGGSGNALAFAELKFYDSLGSPIATTGGTAVASTAGFGSAANAFDGNVSTFWGANVGTDPSHTQWIQYHFASAVSVASFSVTARNDAFYVQAPSSFSLLASNDGSTWTNMGNYSAPAVWTSAAQVQTFTVSASTGNGPGWRLLITGTQSSLAPEIAEFKLYDASGIQISTTGGQSSASDDFSCNSGGTGCGPEGAFDGNTGTFWGGVATPSTGTPSWLEYRFTGSALPPVASFCIVAANYTQAPTTGKLQYTTDHITWTDAGTFSFSWTANGQTSCSSGGACPITVRGNVDYNQAKTTARHGNGPSFQMHDGGSYTPGDVAVYDVCGNTKDSGTTLAGLSSGISSAVPNTRRINTTAPLTGGGDLSADRTLAISNFTGDSGSGGAKGAVPAPAAGDAAANKFLAADGTWAVPPTSGGGAVSSVFGRTGAVTATSGDYSVAQITGAAPLASPTFTGTPAAPTPTAGDNSTKLATTAFVSTAISGLGSSSGGYYLSLTAPPAVSSLTWVNQGTATATDLTSPAGLYLKAPSSSSPNLRCLVKSAPATPWTFTIAQLVSYVPTNFMHAGIILRQSSTGKMVSFDLQYSGSANLSVSNWNSATSYSSSPTGSWGIPSGFQLLFLRVTDNGTNLVFSVSSDPDENSNSPNYIAVVNTISRTAWLTGTGPDQVGIFVDSENSNPVATRIVYWSGI